MWRKSDSESAYKLGSLQKLAIVGLLLIVGVVATQYKPHHVDAVTPACSTSAVAQNNISVAPSHGQAFYIDTGASPKLDAGYVGYRVTNTTGSTQSNLWTEVGSFTGGVIGLSNSLDSYQQLSSLSNNATTASYFLLKANAATTTPQTHHLKVWNGRPDLPGSSMLYDCVYTFSAVKETIKAAANKVSDTGYGTSAAIEVSNTSPELGQTITISVEGTSGTIGAGASPDGSIVWLTPAAISSWPTRALRLESVSVTFERGTSWTSNSSPVTYTDQLMISNAQNCLKKSANSSTCTGGTGNASPEYRAFYTFRVVGIPSTTVKAVPVAQIASGTQIKHADTTATGSTIDINFASVSINASLTKSVTSTSGLQVVTCTITCTVPGGVNGQTYAAVPYRLTASSTSATNVAVDEIVDRPESGVIYKPGTATITDIGRSAVTISDPSYVDSEASMVPRPLHFVGPFNLNSSTTASLNYQMWVPVGSFTNTAYAKIGDLLIGATASAMSKVIVTSDGSGTVGVTITSEDLGVIATTVPASSITSTTATINGTVDPNGANPLTGTFEYSTNSNLSGATTVTATTPTSGILNGLTTPTNVSYNLTGLTSNTTYYFRVIAGSAQGEILSFTTDAVVAPPTVTTTTATSVSSSGATLNGTINPNLTNVLVINFIYGTSATLASGNSTVTLSDGAGGNLTASGASTQPFSTTVAGLSNGTTYYYKLRGCTTSNCSSFVDGSIVSFVAQNPPSNPVLAVTKTEDDADNTVLPGQTITYTVTIANSGGVTGNTSLTDTIPTGLGTPSNFSYTNCGTPGSSYAAPTLSISSITITNVDNCIITYTTVVNTPLNEGTTLTNSVDVAAATEGGNNPAAVAASTLTVNATPNLSTSTKSVSDINSGTVEPGDTLRYTVTLINTGDGQATGASVTDTINSNTQSLTNVGTTNCGSPTNSSTSTQLNVTSVTVAVGTNCVITFDVSVKTPLNENTAISNTATVSAATEGGTGATPSSTTLYTDATPALAVTHSENDADNEVSPNQVVTYTVTIANSGNGQATGISAASSASSNVTIDTGSFNYTSCGSPSNSSTSSSLALSSITVAAGGTCTITYNVSVKNSVTNGATIPSSVDVSAASEGGNNPAAEGATTLTVLVVSNPSGTHFEDGATNLACSGITKHNALRIAWSSTTGAASYDVSLDGGAAVSAGSNTYYDWTLPLADGNHGFSVRSVDSLGNVSGWSSSCVVTLDQTAPTINAGTDKSKSSSFAQTDATATDSTSGIASYSWTKLSGPGTITFTNDSDLNPTISADTDGTYELQLTVTDNAGNSATDTFILVWDTTPPSVDAGSNITTNTSFTQLSSTASDGTSGIASYAWTKVSGPGTVTFTNDSDLHPQISADADGTYVLQLEVTDNLGNHASDTFTLIWDSTAPSVDAGSNINTNTSFTQSSSSASDSGTGIASYAWTKVSGPGTVTFTNDSDLHPSISADADGTYVLKLTVTDNAGNSASDTFTLIWDSTAPSVDAGLNKTTNTSFTQSSSDATDGGTGIASYAWTKVSGPGTVTFTNDSDLHPSISADADGTYVLRLTVTDNVGNSASDTFTLIWDSTAPTVYAGSDKSRQASFVQSDATATDGTSGIASYAWTKLSGPGTITFTNASNLNPTISADTDGTYELQITVTDNAGNTATDTFYLVWDTTAPSIDAGLDKTTSSSFTQSSSSASDGTSGIASYSWSKVSGPGSINFTNSSDLHPQISADTDGTYVLQLTVTDNLGNSATDTFTLVWSTPSVPQSDNDGVTATEEQNAPNGGDANNDGQSDADQKNITSFVNTSTNTYAVLENTSSCQNTNVSQQRMSDLSKADGSYIYPAGLMNFTLVCGNPGATVRVVQYFYGLNTTNLVARKFDARTNTYENIPDAVITMIEIAGQKVVQITYNITDGGALDQDGAVNGTIIDPSGPAVLASSTTAPNTGLQTTSIGQIIALGLFGICISVAGAVMLRRQKQLG